MDDGLVTESASALLLARKDALASGVTARMYEESPELAERYGEEGRQRCLEDMHFNLEHLASAVALDEPGLFVRYVEWLRDLLEARGVPRGDVRRSLELTVEAVEEEIGEKIAAPVAATVRSAIETLSHP